MPGSPGVVQRTWFGIARCDDDGVSIEGAISPWDGREGQARILVVDECGPIDWVALASDEDPKDAIAKVLVRHTHSGARTDAVPLPPEKMTVAVCTRERPGLLRSCLERLHVASADNYDVVVVDNAPRSDATALVVEDFLSRGMRVRRIVEPRPGLSRARNRALVDISTRYVAFTDDDALADPFWPTELHRGFSVEPSVAMVTGIVPPAQIRSESQALFDRKIYKWSNKLEPESIRLPNNVGKPAFPMSTGDLGTGANFAVDREVALDLGGFDESLGAGSLSSGGEDTEMFVRVLRAGFALRFQPAAIVWHLHPSESRELRKIVFGYGKGLSAAACSEFLQPGKVAMLRGSMRGARNLFEDRRTDVGLGTPLSHLVLELAGIACGPVAYAIEKRRKRR